MLKRIRIRIQFVFALLRFVLDSHSIAEFARFVKNRSRHQLASFLTLWIFKWLCPRHSYWDPVNCMSTWAQQSIWFALLKRWVKKEKINYSLPHATIQSELLKNCCVAVIKSICISSHTLRMRDIYISFIRRLFPTESNTTAVRVLAEKWSSHQLLWLQAGHFHWDHTRATNAESSYHTRAPNHRLWQLHLLRQQHRAS